MGDNGPLGGKVYRCMFLYTLLGAGFWEAKGFCEDFCWREGGDIGIWEENILGEKIGFGGTCTLYKSLLDEGTYSACSQSCNAKN